MILEIDKVPAILRGAEHRIVWTRVPPERQRVFGALAFGRVIEITADYPLVDRTINLIDMQDAFGIGFGRIPAVQMCTHDGAGMPMRYRRDDCNAPIRGVTRRGCWCAGVQQL